MIFTALTVQYWPVLRPRRRRLPRGSTGWPMLLGHSLHLLGDIGGWLRSMHAKYGPAFRCSFFGTHVVVVDADVYDRSFSKLDSTARFVPLWPTGFQKLLGPNALQFLDGGSGSRGARHRRLKRKVLDALSPVELRRFLPRMQAIMRQEFDEMVRETEVHGHSCLMPHAMRIVKQVILELVLGAGGIRPDEYLRDTSKDLLDGMIAAPIDLGRFSAYGRAMAVRRAYQRDVEEQLAASLKRLVEQAQAEEPTAETRTMLSRLAEDCQHGAGLTIPEMQDMLISLLFGGSLTTAETMQWLLVELCRHKDWLSALTNEHQRLAGAVGGVAASWDAPEGGRSPCPKSLAACYETLRLHCPIDVLLRSVEEPVDLGDGLGTVPAGWWVAVHLTERGLRQGLDFDPGRWERRSPGLEVSAFGLGPHSCVGRQLALWELQMFLHVWLTGYQAEVLSEETYFVTGMKRFRDGLPVRMHRLPSPSY